MGPGFWFPKILGKYEHIYYVFLSQGHFIGLEAAINRSDGFEKMIRKEAGHKSVNFNNCPLDLCL